MIATRTLWPSLYKAGMPGPFLGKDDSYENTLAIYMNYLYISSDPTVTSLPLKKIVSLLNAKGLFTVLTSWAFSAVNH